MKEKPVYLLLAVFVVLGCAYFIASREWKRTEKAQELSSRLLPEESEAVTGIELKNSSGIVQLVREGEAWRVIQPVDYPADSQEVSVLLEFLGEALAERAFENVSEQEKKDYGLAERDTLIRILAKEKEYELWIGKNAPTPERLYAMKSGDSRVLVASVKLREELSRSLYDFRDKDLFKFDASRVNRLTYRREGIEESVTQDSEKIWRLSHPEGARADGERVRFLLGQLRSARITAFDDDSSLDLAAFGLVDSATRISVCCAQDATPETVLIGRSATDETKIYAMKEGGKTVFELAPSFQRDLNSTWENLRDRTLATVKSWECTQVDIRSASGTIFSASKDGQSNWFMIDPNEGKLDSSKMYSFVQSLTGLQIEAFIDRPEALDRYRLNAPDYEVVLQTGDRTESLPFGVLPPSATDEWDAKWVYSKRPDEPAIVAIDRYFVTLVRQQMLDLMPLPASATEERKTE